MPDSIPLTPEAAAVVAAFDAVMDRAGVFEGAADALAAALRIPVGSPTDKALLRFLAWWGLEPPPSDSALRRMQRLNRHVTSLPHWAVPQPPQGGEVADA